MKHMWAPWRMEYILSDKPQGCILCDLPKENNDEKYYILYRGKLNFIMLNGFPYNPGHLMVAPYRHMSSLEMMTEEERNEHYKLLSRGVEVLREALDAENFNLGMNLGKTAGAGIDDHIHSHIVPRWQGDSNYMTVMGDVRVVPEALADSYKRLVGKF